MLPDHTLQPVQLGIVKKRLSEEAHDAHCTLSANFTILTKEGVDASDSSGQMTTQVEERLDGKLSEADACCYSRPTSSHHVMQTHGIFQS